MNNLTKEQVKMIEEVCNEKDVYVEEIVYDNYTNKHHIRLGHTDPANIYVIYDEDKTQLSSLIDESIEDYGLENLQ